MLTNGDYKKKGRQAMCLGPSGTVVSLRPSTATCGTSTRRCGSDVGRLQDEWDAARGSLHAPATGGTLSDTNNVPGKILLVGGSRGQLAV